MYAVLLLIMIEIIEGRIGGGKTYSALEKWVLRYLANGRHVGTNISINIEGAHLACRSIYGRDFVDEQLHLRSFDNPEDHDFRAWVPSGSPRGGENLLVIDEVQIVLGSMGGRDSQGKAFLEWLAQSRKLGIDCVFISQHVGNIDVQFRRLASYIWRCKDMRHMKIFWGLSYPLPQIIQCQFDMDGRTLLYWQLRVMDKRVFGAYESYKLLREMPVETLSQGRAVARPWLTGLMRDHGSRIMILLIIGTLVGGCRYRKACQELEDTTEHARKALRDAMTRYRSSDASSPSTGSSSSGGPGSAQVEAVRQPQAVYGFARMGKESCVLLGSGSVVGPGAKVGNLRFVGVGSDKRSAVMVDSSNRVVQVRR